MALSKRSHEGWLLIDHRASPGVTAAEATAAGGGAVGVGVRGVFESATITCSHCQAVVVLNPDRTRSRGYCPSCDHFVCDACEALRVMTGVCVPFKQVIDVVQEAAVNNRPLPVLPTVFLQPPNPTP